MDTQPLHFLLIHGAIVLLVGLLAGIPFWIAIIKGQKASVIRAWRVAHTTLIALGLAMLIVGLTNPHLVLATELRTALLWSFVVSGYSFVFALVVGAALGYRALTPGPPAISRLLFLGHFIGGVGSILGTGIFLCGLL